MSSCPLDGNAFLQFDKRGVLCSLQVTERRSGGRPLAVASRPFRAKGRSKRQRAESQLSARVGSRLLWRKRGSSTHVAKGLETTRTCSLSPPAPPGVTVQMKPSPRQVGISFSRSLAARAFRTMYRALLALGSASTQRDDRPPSLRKSPSASVGAMEAARS
jgi:hypothetical protein